MLKALVSTAIVTEAIMPQKFSLWLPAFYCGFIFANKLPALYEYQWLKKNTGE